MAESFLQYLNKRRKEQVEKEEESTGWIIEEESTVVDSRVKITLKDTVQDKEAEVWKKSDELIAEVAENHIRIRGQN